MFHPRSHNLPEDDPAEVVDPEVVDPEVVDPEVVDPVQAPVVADQAAGQVLADRVAVDPEVADLVSDRADRADRADQAGLWGQAAPEGLSQADHVPASEDQGSESASESVRAFRFPLPHHPQAACLWAVSPSPRRCSGSSAVSATTKVL